jgi:hypothetical protein
LDIAIGRQALLAKSELKNLIDSLAGLQGLARLPILNSLVLTGPVFLFFQPPLSAFPEAKIVGQEIATIERVSDFHIRNDYHGIINLELDKLVAPDLTPAYLASDKIPVFLQAITDARAIYFGRLVGHLTRYNRLTDFASLSPDAQRAVALACYVTVLRRFVPEGWYPIGKLPDPIAGLTLLLTLKVISATTSFSEDAFNFSFSSIADGTDRLAS